MKKAVIGAVIALIFAVTITVVIKNASYRKETTPSPEKPDLLWKKEVVGTFDEFAGITVEDGKVFSVGKTMDHAPVTALDADTGEIIWQKAVGSCDSTPSVSGNKVFVINCMWDDLMVSEVDQPYEKERIWCLSSENGDILWSNTSVLPDGGGSPTPDPNKNMVYTCSTDDIYTENPKGRVYAFETENGSLKWSRPYRGVLSGGILFENKYIVSGTTKLAAYGTENGEKIWTNTQIKSWDSLPKVGHNGIMYIGGGYKELPLTLFAVNPKNGKITWNWKAENNSKVALTTPAIHDGRIYFGGFSTLYCVDLSTHDLIWKRDKCGEGPYSTPAIAEGTIYYGSTTLKGGEPDYIFAREADTGDLIWKYEVGTTGELKGIFSQPTISEERLYFTADDGYLRCLSVKPE